MSARMRLLFAMLLSQGCASSFLKGAKMWDHGPPPQFEAKYQASVCSPTDPKEKQVAFNATYFLVKTETGTGLLEVDAQGNGAVFTNTWADEANDYYFGYVRGSQGYLFTVPKDRAQAALRTFYFTVNFVIGAARIGWDVTTGPDGVMKPVGKFAYTCPLAVQPK